MNIEQELNHKQYLAASSQAKHLRIVAVVPMADGDKLL